MYDNVQFITNANLSVTLSRFFYKAKPIFFHRLAAKFAFIYDVNFF